jgi:two-component system, chemotaxis family, protein-glutamate methylesterase/glutaminase
LATHDIVTIGASAGGIAALKRLVSMLPRDFPGAILVAQHLHRRVPSTLDHILARAGTIPVAFARDGVALEHGHVYLAPPDHHLLVEDGRLRVARGPRENRFRPSVDTLFRSAAWTYGPRVVGVVLSGTMDDGAAGLWAIRECGGTTVVQDPKDAEYTEMPTSALITLNVDHCEPLDMIAPLLERLVHEPVEAGRSAPRPAVLEWENKTMTRKQHTEPEEMSQIGKPVAFTCPACHGGLWELKEGELATYRCHVGHSFGPDSLMAAQDDDVEQALEVALRALEEQGAAARRLSERFAERVPALAERYMLQAQGLHEQARVIRGLLTNGSKRDD